MKKMLMWLIPVFAFLSAMPCLSQENLHWPYSIEVGGGASIPLGSTKDGWHTGAFSGTDIFYWPLNYLGAGLRFGFDFWLPDFSSRVKGIDSLRTGVGDGSTTIFEIIPSTRFTTTFSGPVNVFGQFGTGLFVGRQNTKVFGTAGAAQIPFEINTVSDWSAKWGVQVGPGISFSNKYGAAIDILHLYNIIFRHDTFNYFTTNISVRINF